MSELKTLTPGFIVYINGTRLGVEHESSVKRIVVHDRIDGPAGFAVTFSDMDRAWADSSDFSEGNVFSIHLGYKDNIEEVLEGEVTAISTELKKNSTAMTVIKGKNSLHRLKAASRNRVFSEMAIADIISEVASDNGLNADVDTVGGESVFWVQRDQSDFDLILGLAARFNCKVWVMGDTLYFKQNTESQDNIILEWGKTLVEFNGVSDIQNLITEVEVCGWDPLSGEGVVGMAAVADISQTIGNDTLGGSLVEDNFGPRKAILTDPKIIDQNGADSLAMEYITRNSFDYVTAKAKCEGDFRIKAGMEIEIKEVGGRFSGPYLVQEVQHIFQSQSGYYNSLVLVRNAV